MQSERQINDYEDDHCELSVNETPKMRGSMMPTEATPDSRAAKRNINERLRQVCDQYSHSSHMTSQYRSEYSLDSLECS